MTAASDIRIEDREGRSLLGLAAIGIALVLIAAVCARTHDTIDWNFWVLLLVLSGFLALAATQVAGRAPPRRALALIIAIAVVLRLIALSVDPILSTDIYRYVWDGMVQAAGINPYRYVPADPMLAFLRDALIYPNIERGDYATTIYPPLAQMFFFVVTRLGESVTLMRLAFIGCEAVTLVILIDLLRRLGKPAGLAVAYAWHPLPIWEIANNGHVDALMMMLVMAGAWFAVRHRRIVAGMMIALAALAKPYAIVALPACWRPWDWRLPLAVILVVTVCYLPYLGVGTDVLGFLFHGYLMEEGFQSGRGFWLVHLVRSAFGDVPGLLPLYVALAAATLALIARRAAFTADDTPERTTRDIALLLMAGLFFLTPNFAWYYLVIVPFIPLGGGAPAWAMTIGAMLLYLLYPDYDARFLIWKGVINGAFLIALLTTLQRATSAMRLQGLFQWTR